MNWDAGEKTEVAQDDIVFLKRDGSAYGTEQGFYVKTDVTKDFQEAMYYALIDKTAMYENVHIDADGNVNFLDETLCANGRSVIQRTRLRVRHGRGFAGICAKSINLPPLSEMDGLVFAFITRRHTILPFAQELTPEQAALAYLWGESQHSMATNPARAGESVRIVGTDDFIIGSRARKVNRFYEIIMELVDKFPGKVKFYQYNTGGAGEILDSFMEGGKKKKRVVRKVIRVPLDLMAAIQRGDLRGTNTYAPGRFGTREIVAVEGKPFTEYAPEKFYNQDQIDGFVRELVKGRREWTEEIGLEGLRREVVEAAERSFAASLASIGKKGGAGKGSSSESSKFFVPIDLAKEKTPGGFRNF
jgi:phosphoenolpyruvate carboxykinase (ATP)